jgi:hypothetical protein
LSFGATGGAGLCVPNVADTDLPNMHFLTSIDKNTVLGQDYLQSVVFSGANYSASGTILSSILFRAG